MAEAPPHRPRCPGCGPAGRLPGAPEPRGTRCRLPRRFMCVFCGNKKIQGTRGWCFANSLSGVHSLQLQGCGFSDDGELRCFLVHCKKFSLQLSTVFELKRKERATAEATARQPQVHMVDKRKRRQVQVEQQQAAGSSSSSWRGLLV